MRQGERVRAEPENLKKSVKNDACARVQMYPVRTIRCEPECAWRIPSITNSANSAQGPFEAYGLRTMSLAMSAYPHSQKFTGASRHSSLPVARGVDGGELDALRTLRAAPSSEPRMQAAVVCAESSDPYADPPCTD